MLCVSPCGAVQAETSSYTSDGSDAGKMERRGIEKQLLKLVQQVSGTQEQASQHHSYIQSIATTAHVVKKLSSCCAAAHASFMACVFPCCVA